MIKARTMLAVAMSGALLATGATTALADMADTPEGTLWTLAQQSVEGEMTAVPEDLSVTLGMQTGEVDGSGGCNMFSGVYTLDGESLVFDAISFTEMYCDDQIAAVEGAFGANLLDTRTWVLEAEQLLLSGQDGGLLMRFDAGPDATIVGSWVGLEAADASGEMVGGQDVTNVFANFLAAGEFKGFDGCNDVLSTYAVDGALIELGELQTLAPLPCDGELAEISTAVQEALTSAATWSIDADQVLELQDQAGRPAIRFARSE